MTLPCVWLVTHDGVDPAVVVRAWEQVAQHPLGPRMALSVRYRWDAGPLLRLLEQLRTVNPTGILLVSRRVDMAVTAGVGVHLPALGLPVGDVRAQWPGLGPVVRAVHDAAELERARGADAVLVAPVREPRSHPSGRKPLGWDGLRHLVQVNVAPVVAMGGLGGSDVVRVRAAGCVGLAVSTEVWGAQNPHLEAAALAQIWMDRA